MSNVDDNLQAILEGVKMKVPYKVALKILATIQKIEFKNGRNENGRFQNSVRDNDEE